MSTVVSCSPPWEERQRYHVFGTGPVCIVHPGGPGIEWEALRMPAIEADLTTIYVEPIGAGEGANALELRQCEYVAEHRLRAPAN